MEARFMMLPMVAAFCLIASVKPAAYKLTVHPTLVKLGQPCRLTCRVNQVEHPFFSEVQYFRIGKKTGFLRNWETVAVYGYPFRNEAERERVSEMRHKYSINTVYGTLDTATWSQIEIGWVAAGEEVFGNYVCEIHGLDYKYGWVKTIYSNEVIISKDGSRDFDPYYD